MNMFQQPVWIPEGAPANSFPRVDSALREPNGLLAIGGNLAPERLIAAYQRGIFPWFSEDQPILWWSPDPRMVLFPDSFKVSRSMNKRLRRNEFEIRHNSAFVQVMQACAAPRRGQDGTWILDDMLRAYTRLHEMGVAQSLECWHQGSLVGGVYGLKMGRVFFGESMFSTMRDASKVALWNLCQQDLGLIDCQIYSPHLQRLGAQEISRIHFCDLLQQLCSASSRPFEIPYSCVK